MVACSSGRRKIALQAEVKIIDTRRSQNIASGITEDVRRTGNVKHAVLEVLIERPAGSIAASH